MTRAKDISKIVTDADLSGTLDVTGTVTVGGNIANSSGDFTLDVAGDIILDAAGGDIKFFSGGTEFGEFRNISDDLVLISSVNDKDIVFKGQDGGSEIDAMRIDMSAGGNVGIGTNSPNAKLHITDSNPRIRLEDSDGSSHSEIQSNAQGDLILKADPDNNGSSTQISFETDGSEAMRIDNSGNVGIGTTTVSDELHIKGADPAIRIEDTTAVGYARMQSLNGSLILQSDEGNTVSNSTVRFDIDGTEVSRFTHGGILYVGTTDVTSESGLQLSGNGAIYTQIDGTSSVNHVRFYRNGNNIVGKIQTTGTATTYNTSSDYRLKENVTADWDATTRLKQLNPVRFNFITDADTTLDGFLAHEVQSVVAQAVTGTHNEVEVWQDDEELPDGVSVGDNKLDEDGNTIPVYQGIDQSMLVPLLVKTIQELEARITALENGE